MSPAVTITNRSAYGLSAATGSMTTRRLATEQCPTQLGRSALEGLGAQDKVPDQSEEIRAVSLTLYRLERQKTSARCD